LKIKNENIGMNSNKELNKIKIRNEISKNKYSKTAIYVKKNLDKIIFLLIKIN
jgi:hypothetical protein